MPEFIGDVSMTTMVWSILALVVIIALIITGIVIWRKKSDAQVDSLHNIEKQLGEIGDELKMGTEGKADRTPEEFPEAAMVSEPEPVEQPEPEPETDKPAAAELEDADSGMPSIVLPELEEEPDYEEDDDMEPEPEAEPVVIDIASILGSRFVDEEDNSDQNTEAENTEGQKSVSIYNTGRSGRVYTEEELELLIKE